MSTIEVRVRMLPTKGDSAWWTGPTHITPKSRPELTFPFSHVHNSRCTNADLFRALAPLVTQVFQSGSNVTIMAYGQTGSGKTYTMVGREGKYDGVFYLAAEVLIKEAAARANAMSKELREYLSTVHTKMPIVQESARKKKGDFRAPSNDDTTEIAFGLRCAYLEIYNEQIRDLLQFPPVEVDVREGFSKDAIFLDKLSWHSFANIETLQDLLARGEKARATSPTPLNIRSSRSHTILTIERVKLIFERPEGAAEQPTLRIERVSGQLHLVDLAGSECARLAATAGTHLREGGFINKSLLSLGNVVDAIVESRPHIPYRESKLTRILSNSLGMSKNSRTAIICCINPDPANLEQSLAGLRFAQRASKVVVHPKVLGTQPPSCILQLVNLAKQSRDEGKALLKQVYAAGVHDSTCITMRATKRHLHTMTHMFVEECNETLEEYRNALQVIGGEMVAQRDEVRAEIEEIQRHTSYLKALRQQESDENAKLCERLQEDQKDLCASEVERDRLRAALDEANAVVERSLSEVGALERQCESDLAQRKSNLHKALEKVHQDKAKLEKERTNSENKRLKHFLDAENQRAARKQCDFIDIEKAEIEHRIKEIEEKARREKLRREQRKTVTDCLERQKDRLKELDAIVNEKQTLLNQLQRRTYGDATRGDNAEWPSGRHETPFKTHRSQLEESAYASHGNEAGGQEDVVMDRERLNPQASVKDSSMPHSLEEFLQSGALFPLDERISETHATGQPSEEIDLADDVPKVKSAQPFYPTLAEPERGWTRKTI